MCVCNIYIYIHITSYNYAYAYIYIGRIGAMFGSTCRATLESPWLRSASVLFDSPAAGAKRSEHVGWTGGRWQRYGPEIPSGKLT